MNRFLIICKQFWPMSGETELLAGAFVDQLGRKSRTLDLVTWRMIRQWPEQFQYGSCSVIRLPQSQKSSWSPAALGYHGRNRWHRSLQRWVTSHASRYDAAFVFEFDDDGLAPTVIACRAGLPAVSRILQKQAGGISRMTTRELRGLQKYPVAFVTPDQRMLMDPLTDQNGPLQGIRLIADGVPRTSGVLNQEAARAVLGRVHPIFQLSDGALLAVSGCDLTFESGVFSLVRAWRRVSAQHPDARLWLTGSGRNAPELFQRICDLDLQHSVLLTGNFDDVSDLLAAADVYIMPGSGESAGWYSGMAGQLGLTVIHHRDSSVAESSAARVNSILFDDDSRPIDLVVSRWASATRSRSPDQRPVPNPADGPPPSISTMVDQYLALLERPRVKR